MTEFASLCPKTYYFDDLWLSRWGTWQQAAWCKDTHSLPLPTCNQTVTILPSCRTPLYTLDINPLSDIWFANIFPSCGLSFHFSFAVQKLFWFNLVPHIFSFFLSVFAVVSMKSSSRLMSFPCFLLEFFVSYLEF